MNATLLRPTRSRIIPLAILAVASAVSIAVVMSKPNAAGGPGIAPQTVATFAGITQQHPGTAAPVALAESVSVLEPDPEAFDREGVERWWNYYQRAHPVTGVNP
jgi:hypothetical protein